MNYFIESYFHDVADSLKTIDAGLVSELTEEIMNVWLREGTIYIMGNGGSAATASHFACDLSKLTISSGRRRMKAVSLCDNVPILTAWANDTHYEQVFVEQLVPFLEQKDLVIAISASGNSKNVMKALQYTGTVGAKTASMCGFQGGEASRITDYPIITYSDSMQVIEDSHSLLCHGISLDVCQLLKNAQRERLTIF